jgi:hypothetical protein
MCVGRALLLQTDLYGHVGSEDVEMEGRNKLC